jgi:predicted signal transduction protein with EAL and GGDEF domain
VESLLAVADLALYAAKSAGRNRVILYENNAGTLGSVEGTDDEIHASKQPFDEGNS